MLCLQGENSLLHSQISAGQGHDAQQLLQIMHGAQAVQAIKRIRAELVLQSGVAESTSSQIAQLHLRSEDNTQPGAAGVWSLPSLCRSMQMQKDCSSWGSAEAGCHLAGMLGRTAQISPGVEGMQLCNAVEGLFACQQQWL